MIMMIPNNSVGYVKPQVVINQVVVGGTMMINVQSHLHHMAMVVRKYEPYFTLQCFFRPQYIWGLSISMGLPRKILHFKSFQWAFPLLKPLLGYPPPYGTAVASIPQPGPEVPELLRAARSQRQRLCLGEEALKIAQPVTWGQGRGENSPGAVFWKMGEIKL